MWIPGDEREIPTLKMDYGTIPVLHASAGVRRIIGLAYIVTWAWFRHKRNALAAQRNPQDRIVLIVDEVEAHLHPRWQRSVIPAILNAMDELSEDLKVQAHFATHSPLVLASVEPVLRRDEDSLHHLALREGAVELDVVDFRNQGSVDAWLTSDIFGLKHARSIQAEMLIEQAKEEQMKDEPDPTRVAKIDKGLVGHLRVPFPYVSHVINYPRPSPAILYRKRQKAGRGLETRLSTTHLIKMNQHQLVLHLP